MTEGAFVDRWPVELGALEGLDIPHIEQYFGVWAIDEPIWRAMVDRIGRMDVRLHVATERAAAGEADPPPERRLFQLVRPGLAQINVEGTLTKYGSSLLGRGGMVSIRRQVRQASADPEVRAILLRVDSPGGSTAGLYDLVDDVHEANRRKPVYAYIEDLGASAAYAIASQAREIRANRGAKVGSIGTYAVITDLSGLAAREGIKVHVVRAGALKGMGTPGTEVTGEHLAELQRLVDRVNADFLDAVARGRGMTLQRVTALADGRLHVGADAVEAGLIDRIETFDATLDRITQSFTPSNRRKSAMTKQSIAEGAAEGAETTLVTLETQTPGPAGFGDLKAALPGADAEFLCAQLERKATLDEARSAWMSEQNRRIEAARQEAAQAAEKAAAAARKSGVAPLGGSGSSGSDSADAEPVDAFDAAVRERVEAGNSRLDAIRALAIARPDLHQAYLMAKNPGRRTERLIQEKYG